MGGGRSYQVLRTLEGGRGQILLGLEASLQASSETRVDRPDIQRSFTLQGLGYTTTNEPVGQLAGGGESIQEAGPNDQYRLGGCGNRLARGERRRCETC